MVEIVKDYQFDGPDGRVRLIDIFEGRSRLIIYHFMFHPEWEDGCLECTVGSYYFLDLTALGRQEEWEQPAGRSESARSATPDFAS
jgi:predicted dithiol-disulfide oxidoreductase (DUF899 family)